MTAVQDIPRGKSAPKPTTADAYHAGIIAAIPIDLIDVGPNVRANVGELDDMVASIKEHGVLQPIKVKDLGDRWEVVWGQRRLLAAQQAGLTRIPAIIDSSEKLAHERSIEQLVENLIRQDLNPIDEAKALRQVLDADPELTQEELAKRLGRSAPWVSNTLRLLGLDPKVQDKIVAGEISQSHGKAIASLPAKQQRDIAETIVRDGTSAKNLERSLEWKRQEAENDEAKAKRTAKLMPKVLDAITNAGVAKGDEIYVSVMDSYKFDLHAFDAPIKKAGFAVSEHHRSVAPDEGCDCKGSWRLEIDGRGAKIVRACVSDHWRRANDRDRESSNQAQAAARKAQLARLEMVKNAVSASLDVYAPSDEVARLLLFQVLRSSSIGSWQQWSAVEGLDRDQLREGLAEALATEWRLRDVPIDELLTAMGVAVPA
jgi:ParB family chromosome partitioning protein